MRYPMDELGERKEKILNAIIQNYLETGEPVGSRTISKMSDLNLSSATIRNEMSDLEELGYIVQPHTSSGRIPSDKGYRFYVDHLMEVKDREVTEMKDLMIEKTEKMEQLLKQVVKVLANNTQYATMISAPSVQRNRLKINLGLITKLKEQAGIHEEIIAQVLNTVAETIHEDDDLEIYTSGATNIFKYPELSDSQRASELISAFEEKQALADLISETQGDEETGIQVYIGNESPIQTMKDCSVVTATYELGEGVKGTIGIIGPKRMDYENVMDNLKNLKSQLDKILKRE